MFAALVSLFSFRLQLPFAHLYSAKLRQIGLHQVPFEVTFTASDSQTNSSSFTYSDSQLTVSSSLLNSLLDSSPLLNSLFNSQNPTSSSPSHPHPPAQIFHCLNYLDLSRNHLRDVGPVLLIPSLTTLDLSVNELERLPDLTTGSKTLRRLDLRQNRLRSLHSSVGRLEALLSVDLAHNRLVNLDSLLTNCRFLQDLDLSHNRFESTARSNLDSDLAHFRRLRRLVLSHNRLTRLPDLQQSSELCFLDASFNVISVIPDFVGAALKRLEILNLSANRISVVPATLCREASAIKKLSLVKNRIETLSCFFYRMERMKILQLDENPLTTPSVEFVRRRGIPGITAYAMEMKDRADAVAETMTIFLLGANAVEKSAFASFFG